MSNKKNLDDAAAAATAKFFSQNDNTAATEVENKPNKSGKSEKQVFSFRGDKENVKAWRLYASVVQMKVDDLGSAALDEYLQNHPLNATEKAFFDSKINS